MSSSLLVVAFSGCTTEPRVVGVPESGYPSVGYVGYRDSSGSTPICSGILFARDRVLTAAHCLAHEPVDRFWFSVGELFTNDMLYATQARSHPDFRIDEVGPVNDVGTLQLGTAIHDIVPSVLAASPAVLGCGYTVVGYGGAGMTRKSARMCLYETDPQRLFFHPEWGVEGAGVACKGDSGGAVFDSSGAIVGVVSAGDLECGAFAVAMRIDALRSFIDG